MSKLALAGQRRRQPLVALSLVLNVVILGVSMLYWSGSKTATKLPSRRGGPQFAPAFEHCERAQLNEKKLSQWGCKVFNKVCFDQDNVLLHSGEKTPSHVNFTHGPLFQTEAVPAYVLPGYEEPMGTPHHTPPCWDLDIRGPTPYDPPDVWQPKEFTNCTVPVVWWLTYFSVFSDLYIGSVLALDAMLADEAIDRNVLLAPVSLGLGLPAMYQTLLTPYTRHKVTSLSALSSREHLYTGQTRCFERAAVCNMVGMYTSAAQHNWGELRPKLAGRRAVEHFRREHPEQFLLHDKLAAKEKGAVFRVGFMPRSGGLRVIRNLAEVVKECNMWTPPLPFRSVDCVLLPDGTPENHVQLLAQVQHVHALVNTHGSGNTYAFFMPNGSALVEIIPWSFQGNGCSWADQYFSDWFESDHTLNTGYFRLVADKDHSFKGPYEEKNIGSSVAYPRDQDVTLDFPTLAKALQAVAHGQLLSTAANRDQRLFYMTRKDVCPAHQDWLDKRAEKIRKGEPLDDFA